MSFQTTVGPVSEPVSLSEVKDYVRATNDLDDEFLSDLITAGRQAVENNINRRLLTQTVKYTLDFFPPHGVSLPGGDVQSISSFTYQDANNSTQTVSSALYDEQLNKVPAVLLLKPTQSWPDTYDGGNGVSITYVVGWTDTASIPASILIALKAWILNQYDNREAYAPSNAAAALNAYERLLFPYRVV